MINLNDEIKKYQNNGLSRPLSSARVCQDVVLTAISKGALKRNVTIKGGIVMRSITNNLRRATRDMDFDFIQYPLTEEGVDSFIAKLNCIDGITITRVGDIEVYENNEADIVERLNSIFGDKEYLEKLEKAEQRWLDEDINVITKELIEFIERVSCKNQVFMDSQ